ncbi:MAG: cysteine hydrolase family protein [Syntrophobacteraceae bacterium]
MGSTSSNRLETATLAGLCSLKDPGPACSRSTALLIIHMQNDAMDMVPAGRSIVSAIRRVLNGYRSLGLPVIHKRRVHRANGMDVEKFRIERFRKNPFLVDETTGSAILEELKPLEGEIVVKGSRFSAFFRTDLETILRRLGTATIVICGVQTPNCIRATVTDAIACDYSVVLLRDATAAQTPEIHEANLLDMANIGVRILTVDEFLPWLKEDSIA